MRNSSIIDWIRLYPNVAVWITVAKLDASWKHDTARNVGIHATGPGNASPERYKRFGEWFAEGRPVWMPDVGLTDGYIGFGDGRHRFAWLRDHGVQALPVTVTADIAAEVRRRFGTASRTSSLPRKSFEALEEKNSR
jgi:hypothetical protein